MIEFRPHQVRSFAEVEKSWNDGNKNVCLVLPTGAGKTLVKAEMARRCLNSGGIVVIFAHRDVLIEQISDASCLLGIPHTFIAAKSTVANVTTANQQKHGSSFYDEKSRLIIASVDTWIARDKKGLLDHLKPMVTFWGMDETHHLLRENKWGRCIAGLVNAQGLGVTATPWRGDKKGLGHGEIIGYTDPEPIYANNDPNLALLGYTDPEPIYSNDGVFHDLIVGSSTDELIKDKYLVPYKIYAPESKIDYASVSITASGDRNTKQLAKESDRADVTGDVVKHYLRLARGKKAITYCVDIKHSENVAKAFCDAGVPSKSISSNLTTAERNKIIADYKAGVLMNLVNCDLLGEGFDVPAVEVCIMVRRTESFSLFKQQFGRMLRMLEGKAYGILIDHVNNVRDMMLNHGLTLPHEDLEWSLDRIAKKNKKTKKSKVDSNDVTCSACDYFYVSTTTPPVCPDCGHVETKEEQEKTFRRLIIEDGELVEMHFDEMQALIAERAKVDKKPTEVFHAMVNAPQIVRNSAVNNHIKRQMAQTELREAIQKWCEIKWQATRWTKESIQLEFQRVFGIHFLKAQTLSERQSKELLEKIRIDRLKRLGLTA